MKCRLGYLVTPKPELLERLGIEQGDDPFGTVAVITPLNDYEQAFEGWKKAWLLKAKQDFVADFLDVWSDNFQEFVTELRGLSAPENFDRWWTISLTEDVIEIDASWKPS